MTRHVRSVEPDATVAAQREAAYAAVAEAVQAETRPNGLRVSPLGAAWSSDVDAHLFTLPEARRLEDRGWLRLDDLLRRIGSDAHDCWAIVQAGRIVGVADLHTTVPPDPVEAVLQRCRRRGEIGPRERAELAVLSRQGYSVPATIPIRRRPVRRMASALRKRLRPRLLVAVSGVDGAGKSTLTTRLVADLRRAGLPAARMWARPGAQSTRITALAGAVKRVTRQDRKPGVRRAAAGEGHLLPSRRGVVGLAWTILVALDFCVSVWSHVVRSHGVLVFDRHDDDALVTLRVFYDGARLEAAEWIARTLLPRPHVRIHIDVPLTTALARKPGDTVGKWAVSRQLVEYESLLSRRDVLVLDGESPMDELTLAALRHVLGAVAGEGK